MNELLEAKLVILQIKTKLLDLAGELIADKGSTKDYAIKRMLGIVEFAEEHDVKIKKIEIKKKTPIKAF